MESFIHSTWGAAHFAAALVALVLGPVLFVRVKADRAHRVLGYVYVAAMVVVCVAGWPIRSFGGLSPFHYLSVISFVTVLLGAAFAFAAARLVSGRKARDGLAYGHMMWMVWSYIGLVAAGVSQMGSRLALAVFGEGAAGWIAVALATAATVAIGMLALRLSRTRLAHRYFPRAIRSAGKEA